MDCGPTCLKMIAAFHGRKLSNNELRAIIDISREGTSLHHLAEAAQKLGFNTECVQASWEDLEAGILFPMIAFWDQNHYVVVRKVGKKYVHIVDPAVGNVKLKKEDFLDGWSEKGYLLLLEPGDHFVKSQSRNLNEERANTIQFLVKHLKLYKKEVFQLLLGLFAGSIIQLMLPFLSQKIVDQGIVAKDLNIIYLILLAQIMLFCGHSFIDFSRNWLLMHVSTKINIVIVSDFFQKLMKLPISYFDSKMSGDIFQRIGDHKRIEYFLTSGTLSALFSAINIVIFGVVLLFYNATIFYIFLSGSFLYVSWILFFMKRREEVDFERFKQGSKNQNKVIEMITGMQEIKLNKAEKKLKWQWEKIQVRLFEINLRGLKIEELQNIGSALINEVKNILITYYTAKLVIDQHMTLGMMMSVSFIIGQLNSPIFQLIGFIQSYQDAKISIDRMSDINEMHDEETADNSKCSIENNCKALTFNNVNFYYPGTTKRVLDGINFEIPIGKITAIVGGSGSGKTTLMKLLLQFYSPQKGQILIGQDNLTEISPSFWRTKCAAIMQEGYIFSDTIAANIAVGEENIDNEKLQYAIKISNIAEFVDELTNGTDTVIGREGLGLSTGQKQRILIARAIYKNPDFLFLDEASSALDAKNERIITENLKQVFKNKTIVIIAHRLSTVKDADQIVVLQHGKVAEIGNHISLCERKGAYFDLVKNQLELER